MKTLNLTLIGIVVLAGMIVLPANAQQQDPALEIKILTTYQITHKVDLHNIIKQIEKLQQQMVNNATQNLPHNDTQTIQNIPLPQVCTPNIDINHNMTINCV